MATVWASSSHRADTVTNRTTTPSRTTKPTPRAGQGTPPPRRAGPGASTGATTRSAGGASVRSSTRCGAAGSAAPIEDRHRRAGRGLDGGDAVVVVVDHVGGLDVRLRGVVVDRAVADEG